MNYFVKLGKKLSSHSSHSSHEDEENKHNHHRKISVRRAREKQLALSKVNLNSVYNREEDYKPLPSPGKTDGGHHQPYEKNTNKIKNMIEDEHILDIEALRKVAWQGVPHHLRHNVWRILLKYAPLNRDSRDSTISRKRAEYNNFKDMYYNQMDTNNLGEQEFKTFEVIKKDVYRTQPEYPFFKIKVIQDMMIRLLWVWNVRHPASGYVQGINDLTTPFVAAFAVEYFPGLNYDTFEAPKNFDEIFTEEIIGKMEADIYWCLCKILDGILDNYTFSQTSGTQKTLNSIKEITKKLDSDLANHLEQNEVNFSFFSFRWIFCLLIREFPLRVGMRLFDTYIADEEGFNVLHTYVCVALLLKWSLKLKKMGFNDIMLFLQNMPTKDWGEKDVEVIIAEAFVFKSLYEDTHGHFASSQNSTTQSATSLH